MNGAEGEKAKAWACAKLAKVQVELYRNRQQREWRTFLVLWAGMALVLWGLATCAPDAAERLRGPVTILYPVLTVIAVFGAVLPIHGAYRKDMLWLLYYMETAERGSGTRPEKGDMATYWWGIQKPRAIAEIVVTVVLAVVTIALVRSR